MAFHLGPSMYIHCQCILPFDSLSAHPRLMCHCWISRRRIEPSPIYLAALHGPLQFIIDFEDDPLGAILATLLHLLLPVLPERIHNMVHILVLSAIEVEIGGIQFAAQKEAPLLVPAEGRTIIATVFGKGFQDPGGVGSERRNTFPAHARNELSVLV